MLVLRHSPQRGRGLYTTRHVQGGEVVLEEAPLLLVAAHAAKDATCAACLRHLASPWSGVVQCPGCQQASFCSPACKQASESCQWVHGPDVCRAYQRLGAAGQGEQHPLRDEQDLDAARFLVHALCLKALAVHGHADAIQRCTSLLSLVGDATEVEARVAARLKPVLEHALSAAPGSVDAQEVATLLRKEQLNSYGILAPQPSPSAQAAAAAAPASTSAATGGLQRAGSAPMSEEMGEGERLLRGSALYAQASLINHECNPNVARFDAFDQQGPGSTHVSFRAMHDLPAGTEVFQSYCPLSWDYEERQGQCREVYGFTCTCQRCQMESRGRRKGGGGSDEMQGDGSSSGGWMTDDEGGGAGGGGEARMADGDAAPSTSEPGGAGMALDADGMVESAGGDAGSSGPLDPTYLQLFLLKYVCPLPYCFGTMAPVGPGMSMHECAVCGHTRSEEQFLQELEGPIAE